MKEIKRYRTEDNCVFDTKEAAIKHEIFLSYGLENLKNDINDFLKEKDNYDEWTRKYWKDNYDELAKSYWKKHEREEEFNLGFHFCASISKANHNNYNLTIYDSKESKVELKLDENFSIDMDKWYKFKENIKSRFGINITTPLRTSEFDFKFKFFNK